MPIDTAQRRADSERLKAHELLKRIVGIVPMAPEQRCARIDWLVEYAQQARRDALAEAGKVAREFKGGFTLDVFSCKLVPDKDGPWTLGSDIAEALDRLREGR